MPSQHLPVSKSQKNSSIQKPSTKSAPAQTTAAPAPLQSTLPEPLSASPEQMLQLQQRAGNRAVQRMIQRAQSDEVQRTAEVGLEGGEVSGSLQSQIESARGGGQPLDRNVGGQIGGALGADLSGVRVHTDSRSDSLNRSLNAKAFTLGSDVFFSQGAYNPGTHSGKQLLAHELTHVVQQGGGASNRVQTKLTVGPAGDQYEQEADRVAGQVLSAPATGPALGGGLQENERIQPKRSPGGLIQRSIFTQMRVKLFGQKAGKTIDEVTNPRKSVSKAFKTFAASKNAAVELKFLRELNALAAGTINFETVDAFMKKYHDRVEGLDYSEKTKLSGEIKETQLKKFTRLKGKNKDFPLSASWLRAALGEVSRRAESKLSAVVDQYNTAHNRMAAPGAGGWNVNEGGMFGQRGVAPTQYTTGNQAQAPRVLGSGGVNTVYEHKYTGEGDKLQVFKEDQDFDIAAGLHPGTSEGIPERNPEFAKRAVAMSRLAEALGSSVIAKTAFAVSGGRFGTVQEKAKDHAMEDLTEQQRDAIKNDPNFQRALSQLQMIDIIAGQMDRHQGNYFVQLDKDGNFVALKGIDLDLAFGKKTTAMSTKFKAGTLGEGNKQIKKFDSKFADVLIALDPQVIRDALQGLLSDEEIQATIQRFTDLRDYLIEVKAGRKQGQEMF